METQARLGDPCKYDVAQCVFGGFLDIRVSCAHNKTSEFSINARSGILGLLGAEQDVGNLKIALPGILGLLCAEQHVGNINNMTFRNSGTLVRFTCTFPFWLLLPSGSLQNAPPKSSQIHGIELSSGQPWAPSCSSRPDEETHFATSRFPCVYYYFPACGEVSFEFFFWHFCFSLFADSL